MELLRIAAVASVVALTCGCTEYPQQGGYSTKGNGEPLAIPARTKVTPYLECKIEPGENLVWCATFQMAWDELKGLAGGPINTIPESGIVSSLNREPIDRKCLPAVGVMSIAGLASDGIMEEIVARMRKLPGSPKPTMFPGQGQGLSQDAVIMYSYLARRLLFETAFEPLGAGPFAGSGAKVSYFGIRAFTRASEAKKRQGSQVRVIWHRFNFEARKELRQEYIIELATTEVEDRLILARVAPASTLRDVIDMVLEHVERPNTKTTVDGIAPEERELEKQRPSMSERAVLEAVSGYRDLLLCEKVRVPRISVKCSERFNELVGLRVLSRNDRVNMKPIIAAEQRIRFELDEEGVELVSEAYAALFGGEMREFTFAGPFLLIVMRRGASMPYCALWVANTQVLCPSL